MEYCFTNATQINDEIAELPTLRIVKDRGGKRQNWLTSLCFMILSKQTRNHTLIASNNKIIKSKGANGGHNNKTIDTLLADLLSFLKYQ